MIETSPLRTRVAGLRAEFEDYLAALVEMPTVSMDPARRPEMDRCAAAYRITPREREIIRLVGSGLSNPEIARRLFLSPQTVKNQIHGLFQKLGVRNRVQLVNFFRQAADRRPAENGSSSVPAKGD